MLLLNMAQRMEAERHHTQLRAQAELGADAPRRGPSGAAASCEKARASGLADEANVVDQVVRHVVDDDRMDLAGDVPEIRS